MLPFGDLLSLLVFGQENERCNPMYMRVHSSRKGHRQSKCRTQDRHGLWSIFWRAIVINYQSGDHTSTSTWMNIYLYIHTQCCSTYHEFDYREKGDIEMLHTIFFVSLLLLRLYPCSLLICE